MTKERLRRYQTLKREKAQLLAQIDRLKDRDREIWAALTSVTSKQDDGLPRGGKATPDAKMVDLLNQREQLSKSMEDTAAQYLDKVAEMDAELLAVETAITALDPVARTLLRYRYIDGMKWEDICVKMNYSWRQTHRLHGEALKKLNP